MSRLLIFIVFFIVLDAQAQDIRTVPVETNTLIYSEKHDRLIATISSFASTIPNSIALINPATGLVDTTLFLGSNPTTMALSDDDRVLYVELRGLSQVVKVDLDALRIESSFVLELVEPGGNLVATDMEVLPGNSDVVAMVLNTSTSGASERVVIYDDGVPRELMTSTSLDISEIEFGDNPDRLYAYNSKSTGFQYYTMDVTEEGVILDTEFADVLTGFSQEMEFANGKLYSLSGRVIDPETAEIVGTFPINQRSDNLISFAVDAALNRTYYLARNDELTFRVMAFDNDTYSLMVTDVFDTEDPIPPLVLVGAESANQRGFAFRNSSRHVGLLLSGIRDPLIASLQFSDKSLDMGNVPGPTELIETLKNTGNAELRVDSVLSEDAQFSFSPSAFTIAPGDSIEGVFTFDPEQFGRVTTTLSFYTNTPNTVEEIEVSAFGIVRSYTLEQEQIDFGLVAKDSLSEDRMILESNSNQVINISRISSTNDVFVVTDTSVANAGLSSFGRLFIPIGFRPDSLQIEEGYLIIESDAVSSPDSLFVTGQGALLPLTRLKPNFIDLGAVPAGSKRDTSFQVFNLGVDTLKVSNITSTGEEFVVSPASFALVPGDSLAILVSLLATQPGDVFSRLELESNDPADQATIGVFGRIIVDTRTEEGRMPTAFALKQNYPNPVQAQTTIPFDIPVAGRVTINLYNGLGQEVGVLIDQQMPAGAHSVTFDASMLPSGVYIYTLKAKEQSASNTLTIVR